MEGIEPKTYYWLTFQVEQQIDFFYLLLALYSWSKLTNETKKLKTQSIYMNITKKFIALLYLIHIQIIDKNGIIFRRKDMF